MFAIDLDVGNIVFENGGDVNLWESSLGKDNQQTGFATGTVADDDELSADFSHGLYGDGM